MARRTTIGFETATNAGSGGTPASLIEGLVSGINVSNVTSPVRTGIYSKKVTSAAGNVAGNINLPLQGLATSNITWYIRGYFRIPSGQTRTANVAILTVYDAFPLPVGSVILSTTNTLQGAYGSSDTTFGNTASMSVDTWTRVELCFIHNSAANDTVEVKIDGVSLGTTTAAITSGNLASVKMGFLQAPGANCDIYIDDIAINDSTGTHQNSWPGEGKIELITAISDISNTSWTTGDGTNTTNLYQAIDARPPVGVASASQNSTSNIESAVKTTNTYKANMIPYLAVLGSPKNINQISTPINVGQLSSGARVAVKFVAPTGDIKKIGVAWDTAGTPTNTLSCKIYSDSSNTPNTSIYTSPTTYTGSGSGWFFFNILSAGLTSGTTYWISLEASGIDASNYWNIKTDGTSYPSNSKAIYNNTSSSWTASSTSAPWFSIITDMRESSTIKIVQAVVDTAEDISTGTKTGTFQITSNPAQSGTDAITAFGNDAGAAGTWPTNWYAYWGTAQYYPSVTLGTSLALEVVKTDTGTRTALIDFMGIYIEYVDVDGGPSVTFDNTTFPDQNYYMGPHQV
jgi:hypothetical protein